MKKLLFIPILFLSALVFAQSPEAFSYQSVIRDGAGELVANEQVGIQISILQGSASGLAVYTETHTPTTNANGLASLEIGEGTPSTGVFGSINWGNGPYFVETSTDPAGGTNYSISSVSQLLSVPYALHSSVADSLDGISSTALENSLFLNKTVLSGTINLSGIVQSGTGFTCVKLNPGVYELTFEHPFISTPLAFAQAINLNVGPPARDTEIQRIGSNTYRIYTISPSAGLVDSAFSILFIGDQP